ncbi:hypothetical protein RI129_009925 [Pyrocoelia pectoralis]|uniref:Uncharacterized protein n=1 Tax=Pyrocoelia pectoralis TaxID=417401 RepID=A0AAN7ZJC3_9COLE
MQTFPYSRQRNRPPSYRLLAGSRGASKELNVGKTKYWEGNCFDAYIQAQKETLSFRQIENEEARTTLIKDLSHVVERLRSEAVKPALPTTSVDTLRLDEIQNLKYELQVCNLTVLTS